MGNNRMWLLAYLHSIVITSMAIQYFWRGEINAGHVLSVVIGAVIGWVVITRAAGERFEREPMVDERQWYHALLSGYRAFLFLNLLIIGALLQPWLDHDTPGLWIGILVAGLFFWVGQLLILERKG